MPMNFGMRKQPRRHLREAWPACPGALKAEGFRG